MQDIRDAGLLLLDLDLLVQLCGHAFEIGDHHFDLRNLPALLVDLEFLEPDQALAARLHDLYSLPHQVSRCLTRGNTHRNQDTAQFAGGPALSTIASSIT